MGVRCVLKNYPAVIWREKFLQMVWCAGDLASTTSNFSPIWPFQPLSSATTGSLTALLTSHHLQVHYRQQHQLRQDWVCQHHQCSLPPSHICLKLLIKIVCKIFCTAATTSKSITGNNTNPDKIASAGTNNAASLLPFSPTSFTLGNIVYFVCGFFWCT